MKTTEILNPIQRRRLATLLVEMARREKEALNLYQPLPQQENFHLCQAREQLIRGGNRAGKTLATAVEVARAVTNQDPHKKWPKSGRFLIVGKDLKHVGQVIYRKLFRPGAFKMIWDRKKTRWRAFRPWVLDDQAMKGSAKPAMPLIPKRFLESTSWTKKKDDQPNIFKLRTGWEMIFCSSESKPPQGIDVDGVWFDEEIIESSWYNEAAARLVDRAGRFLWSATPQLAGEQLYMLHTRAMEQEDRDKPDIVEHYLDMEENPHIPADEIRRLKDKYAHSEELTAVRIKGEYAIDQFKVWPEFDEAKHTVTPFTIPEDWMRVAIVDPGASVCAVLFAAVPPPDHKDWAGTVHCYKELYIRRCSAELFGEEFAKSVRGESFFAFLMDRKSGEFVESGTGRSIGEQYTEALVKRKVASQRTGSKFYWGAVDVEAGVLAARGWMEDRPQGPKLRIHRERCEMLIWEIKNHRRRPEKQPDGTMRPGKPRDKFHDHLIYGLRALACYNPEYSKPVRMDGADDPIYAAWKKSRKDEQRRNPSDGVHLGPAQNLYIGVFS